jgi:hypothetical protein
VAHFTNTGQQSPLQLPGFSPFLAELLGLRELARRLLNRDQDQPETAPMYTATFFSTTLGRTALACIVAMLALNLVALGQQFQAAPVIHASAAGITGELA